MRLLISALVLLALTTSGARAFLILGAGSNSSASAPSTFIYLPNSSFVYLPNGSYAQVRDGGSGTPAPGCGTLNLAVNTTCNSVSVPTVLE